MFEMLYWKASHDAYGVASSFAVEESLMLKIGKFQVTVQNVVQFFRFSADKESDIQEWYHGIT